jgi:octaprenyl-diphosphate synthase
MKSEVSIKPDLRDILKPLEIYLAQVEENIKSKFTSGVSIIDESAFHLFTSGGKRVRAALVLLISGLRGTIPKGIIELAAAVEIVHAATLIHDDIIDQSNTRRGIPTVHRQWGNKISVLVGDYMYTVSLNAAVQDGNPSLFPLMVSGTSDMVMGELYQLQYSNIESISENLYFKIIELKTARFMAMCSKMGAIKANFNPDECEVLYTFGLNIGFAFQIIDDTLDLIESTEEIGKDIGNDFRDGKVTLPFLYLMQKLQGSEKELLGELFKNPTNENWLQVRGWLKEKGALQYALNIAKDYVKRAQGLLDQFQDTQFKKILIDLSNFFIYRGF